MYELHQNCMLPKYGKKLELCHMDTVSVTYYIKTYYFLKYIAGDKEKRFDTSGQTKEDARTLQKEEEDFRFAEIRQA